MIVYVELLTPALAEITVVPRWWRRWFRRERETERYATRVPRSTGGWRWVWDGKDAPLEDVDADVAEAIQRAELAMRTAKSTGGTNAAVR